MGGNRLRQTITIAMAVIGSLVVGVSASTGAQPVAPTRQKSEQSSRPNIILILMDDMGWRDVGFMRNEFVETPHLDQLAQNGLLFTQAYASAPNCAPTRACLMSGQYTPRHGVYTVVDPRQPPGSPWHPLMAAESRSELGTGVVTVAEALRDGGYSTGFFGMWNLGRGRSGPVTPGGQGFERVVFPETLGFGKDAYFDDEGRYLSDRLTDSVIEFIEEHSDDPYFVYLADHAVHAPFEPKQDLLRKYEKKASRQQDRRNDPAYAATIEAVDLNVGRLMEALQRLNQKERTLVIFTSDNGGTPQFTAPLKGSKGQLYEGGIRVPLVMSWPELKTSGSRCDVPVSSVDLYPTLMDIAGIRKKVPQVTDGVSLVPVMKGTGDIDRKRLFWHFPCYVGRATPSSAIREGDYKLIESFEEPGQYELYHLKADPGEQNNLVAAQSEKAASLYRTLQQWQKETGAAIPRDRNPSFDPNAERPRGGPGHGGGPGNSGGNSSANGERGRKNKQPGSGRRGDRREK